MRLNLSDTDLQFYLRQIEKAVEGTYPAPMSFDGWVTAAKVLDSGIYTSVSTLKKKAMAKLQASAVTQGVCSDEEFMAAVGLEQPFKVDDQVYYVPRDQRWDQPRYKFISKVGRKWIYCGDRFRFDKETLQVDGGQYSSPGRVYRQLSDYEAVLRRNRKYQAIAKTFDHYGKRDRFDEDQLDRVIAILDIDVEGVLKKK